MEYTRRHKRFRLTSVEVSGQMTSTSEVSLIDIGLGGLSLQADRRLNIGGTYMLNVGPDGIGRIPEQSARILREVGQWVYTHENAIHGAGPTPFGPLAWPVWCSGMRITS